eukprot:TRINITY_DN1389_c3_g1_i6.p1 TRINITY_DN1389_c3_g1~~TRINITY_DN1389_c3_g1_i6.p1  ORF type:complete len:507 (-),score=130.52 TRINITY_DN1389_c3_g1_i6:237-1664(-)
MADELMKMAGLSSGEKKKGVMMFHIGTNNWQRQGEFAPGSGILHASFHQTFNSMDGVKCYSIYPSKNQTDPVAEPDYNPTFKIFKINHDIPICESVSPNSNFRWHSMSEDDFKAYRQRQQDEICAFMDEIEEREGQQFDYLISHHAFTNAMTGADIVKRRQEEGNKKLRHFNFVHGTALKMYLKEKEKDPEYPERFLKLTQEHGVFNGTGMTSGVWVNSKDYIEKFASCFESYDMTRAVYSQIGVNQKTFCPKPVTIDKDVVPELRDADKKRFEGIKRIVTFVGKFADWKRLDAVLYAAAEYEKKFEDLGTIIIGSGPPEAIEQYEGLAKKLELKRCFFLGPKGQDVLAKFFTMSEVGLFPSWKEPFGMVFVECMACGCPTIGAKSGGPTEFVKPAQGLLIDEEEEWRTEEGISRFGKRLGEAVDKALTEDWKTTKKDGCVKFVEENFSTTAQCSAMLKDMKKWSKEDEQSCTIS